MAERDDDQDVSRRYRELPHEEPPPALDARIRAEARAALETHAAPLVAPTGRRRWYFPVAAAAIIVLAVAVTPQVERAELDYERPAEAKKKAVLQEKPQVAEQKSRQPAQVDALAKRNEPQPFAEKPKDRRAADAVAGARSREDFSRDNRERQERPAASPPAAAPASPPAPAAEVDLQRRSQADTRQPQKRADSAPEATEGAKLRKSEVPGASVSGALSSAAPQFQTPDAWLTNIEALRATGSDDEADKSLAEFRKRYPDYKIPPERLEKVERKKAR